MAKKTSVSNVTPAQLNTRLKKGELLSVYLLYGPEQGLLQAMAERLIGAAGPGRKSTYAADPVRGRKAEHGSTYSPLPNGALFGGSEMRGGQ